MAEVIRSVPTDGVYQYMPMREMNPLHQAEVWEAVAEVLVRQEQRGELPDYDQREAFLVKLSDGRQVGFLCGVCHILNTLDL